MRTTGSGGKVRSWEEIGIWGGGRKLQKRVGGLGGMKGGEITWLKEPVSG